MRSASLALGAVLMLVIAPASAARADDIKPLRTLTYDVAYTLSTSQDVRVSGLTGGQPHDMETGRAAVQRGFNSNDRGTLQIDVIAAPADGTLVVDATYTGRESKQPAIRVVVFSDGSLSYDPKRVLSAQARRVVPLLARGILADHDVSPGSSWTTPFAKPASGTTTYRVSHREDTRATIAIAADFTVPGPSGYEEHDDGTTSYATDVLCPLTYDGRFRVRRQITPEQLESADSHVTATLVSDSFAKKT
jgi:hypothetical protein